MHDSQANLAGELSAQERVLGTTAEALRDRRIRYVNAPPADDSMRLQRCSWGWWHD
ncbi:hypothetical protein [Mycobacterium riyadhense]|uniref:hypothetical protein n=1 Tax=Mycobacterium riyadhense TaxID=486698 RepID=UPI00146FC6BD|nr:hypothetical protein [Mycobacterium riyadhense]MCV7148807.1 hypothetical protein [Mycobacterium riyadhense]